MESQDATVESLCATMMHVVPFCRIESKTSASTVFGCKQLLHEPVMGGGVWTAMAVPLVFKLGPWPVIFISLGVVAAWIVVWLVFLRRPRAENVV